MAEDLFRVGLDFGPAEPIMKKEEAPPEPEVKEPEVPQPVKKDGLLTLEDDFFKEFVPEEKEVEKEEEEPEVEEPEVKEPETDDPEEITPSTVLYNFLRENEMIPEIENFDGSADSIKEVLNQLPDMYIQEALNTIHEDTRVLLQYAYNLGGQADVAALKAFFDEYYEPQLTEFDITTDEGARAYLADMFRRKQIYDSAEDINNALDMLADQDKIKTYAQNKYVAEKEELDRKAAEKAKQAEAELQARREAEKKRRDEIIGQLQQLEWTEERKMKVAQNLNPQVASQKTSAIMKSPKAIIQLADFYTYFDDAKGEFDIEAMITAKAESLGTKQTQKKIESDAFSSSLSKLKSSGGKQKPSGSTKGKVIVPSIDVTDEHTARKLF